jgi:hypothetical protein
MNRKTFRRNQSWLNWGTVLVFAWRDRKSTKISLGVASVLANI